jgi:hypothetical protein
VDSCATWNVRRHGWEGVATAPEFPRKVLDLLEAGRRVADVARDLQLIQETI